MSTHDDARIQWEKAESFSDLCELTAQVVEGNLLFFPMYGEEEIDPAPDEIRSVLAIMNRSGLLTIDSQPGMSGEDGSGQRAYVTGYAKEETAKKLYLTSLCSDLLVFVAPAYQTRELMLPVTLEDYHPFDWCGNIRARYVFEYFAEHCSRSAFEEMKSCWGVCVIDLCWGRNELLWTLIPQTLAGEGPALRYCWEAHPELEVASYFLF